MSKKITTARHYRITLTGGSTYYGRTTQPGDDRYNRHLGCVRLGTHPNKHIQEVYNKYGYDDWVHEWLSTETGDKQHHDQIEYGRVQADPKSLNKNKGYSGVLLEGGNREHTRQQSKAQRDAHTPEEREEYNRLQREYYHEVKARMTPEELKEFNKKEALKRKNNRSKETPEQYEERLRKVKEYQQRKRDEKKRGGDNK